MCLLMKEKKNISSLRLVVELATESVSELECVTESESKFESVSLSTHRAIHHDRVQHSVAGIVI